MHHLSLCRCVVLVVVGVVAGYRVLFAGVQPRVLWIGIGGFFFFGSYEKAKSLLHNSDSNDKNE